MYVFVFFAVLVAASWLLEVYVGACGRLPVMWFGDGDRVRDELESEFGSPGGVQHLVWQCG